MHAMPPHLTCHLCWQARVWYNAFFEAGSGAWVFNYNLYYG